LGNLKIRARRYKPPEVQGSRVKVAVVQRMLRKEEYNLDELKELCRTAGYEPVYSLTQVRPPHPKYNIGPGKAEELKRAVKSLGIHKVIFENDLKPVQEYNLAKLLGVQVISRIQLILEIFTLHAESAEARLQIKLAELKYELSRAKEKVKLAKKGEQPGFHGLGAYEADVYYDEISRRIAKINEKLERIRNRRMLFRRRRIEYGIPTISLTGYTNAGKSTLFNALAKESVPVSQQLFTTLSTTTRVVRFDGKKAFLSDTVGFIKNLPPLLVDAFNSTLSELIYSDLILLVVDVTEPVNVVREKINSSLDVLDEVGVSNVPILLVFNKIDLVNDAAEVRRRIEELGASLPYVAVSALKGINLDLLSSRVAEMMGGYIRIKALLTDSPEVYDVLSMLKEECKIINLTYNGSGYEIDVEAPVHVAEKVKKMSSEFRVVGGYA